MSETSSTQTKTGANDVNPGTELPLAKTDSATRRDILFGAAAVASAAAGIAPAMAKPFAPGGVDEPGVAKLLLKLKPASIKFQPKIIGPEDPEILKEWERLTTTRFGLDGDRAATVSKTIDSCPGGGLDMTDTD